jgi:hypothetical protein
MSALYDQSFTYDPLDRLTSGQLYLRRQRAPARHDGGGIWLHRQV